MLQQPKQIMVRLQYAQSINLLIIIQEIKLSLVYFSIIDVEPSLSIAMCMIQIIYFLIFFAFHLIESM